MLVKWVAINAGKVAGCQCRQGVWPSALARWVAFSAGKVVAVLIRCEAISDGKLCGRQC